MADSRYRAFAATVETGSLTRAASMLGYTQSGVSHLIGALEEELGISLLVRSRSGATLTDEGRRILPYVQEMLRAADAVQSVANDMKGLKSGTLKVGTFSSVALEWLPGILSEYTTAYPGIDVRVTNGTYSVVEDALADGALDCAFVTMPSRDDFSTIPLAKDKLLAIVPSGHRLASMSEVTPSDIADEPFVLPAEGSNYDIGKLFHNIGRLPNIRLNMNDDYAAIEMVRHGMGITILPELLLKDLMMEGISAITISGTTRQIGIATGKDRWASPAVKVFIECTRRMIRS